MKLTWKRKTGRFQNGESLYVGKWMVGSVDWRLTSRTGPDYEVTCRLPGIKNCLPGDNSSDKAKEMLEKAVKYWMSKLDEDIE